jgi:hypothetical protein
MISGCPFRLWLSFPPLLFLPRALSLSLWLPLVSHPLTQSLVNGRPDKVRSTHQVTRSDLISHPLSQSFVTNRPDIV